MAKFTNLSTESEKYYSELEKSKSKAFCQWVAMDTRMQTYPPLLVSYLKEEGCSHCDCVILDQDGGHHSINMVLLASKSKYFLAKFEWTSRDKKEIGVDYCKAKPMAAALSWVVTGQLEVTTVEEVTDLMEVAEYLLMDDLSSHCQQVMIFGNFFETKIRFCADAP